MIKLEDPAEVNSQSPTKRKADAPRIDVNDTSTFRTPRTTSRLTTEPISTHHVAHADSAFSPSKRYARNGAKNVSMHAGAIQSPAIAPTPALFHTQGSDESPVRVTQQGSSVL